MELTERKKAVLKAIVKAYIDTGEPIGSKNLALLLENSPSSATLRNEMSELCDMGFLSQPHTSAGRVPTSKGYKLYIKSLAPDGEADSFAKPISDMISSVKSEPERIPETAVKVLSEITGLPAIACLITEKMPRIKRVQILPIGRYSAMLLVITDDGRTRNCIFRQGKNFGDELKNCFEELIEKYVKGKEVSELTKAYMQSVTAKAGLYSLELMPILSAVFETAREIESSNVVLSSESLLYNICSDEMSAGKITALIKKRDPIISILRNIDGDDGVIFGADTGYGELNTDTIVASKFRVGDKYSGYVAVLGPNRMSYEQIIPFTKYTASALTETMTEAQCDMED